MEESNVTGKLPGLATIEQQKDAVHILLATSWNYHLTSKLFQL